MKAQKILCPSREPAATSPAVVAFKMATKALPRADEASGNTLDKMTISKVLHAIIMVDTHRYCSKPVLVEVHYSETTITMIYGFGDGHRRRPF